jgi:acetylornithine/succinyldiaminopimelate/putrescine aminotransferase
VFISLNGNYHGTDIFAQRLRDMWPRYFRNARFVQIEPNDIQALRNAFRKHRGRVAAFFFEPILMNREAILLQEDSVRESRAQCDRGGALMVVDEIQTGFWCPEVFMFRQYGIVPDIVIVGKGMTAGFHPLSAIIYKRKLDCLAQYDAISTNGGAPLAALVGLACLALMQRDRKRIAALSRYYFDRFQEMPERHPDRVSAIHGKGLLAGIKFREVKDALDFHRRCVARGLWVRAHAYHEGHSTVLTKLGLAADKRIADFIVDTFLHILREMEHG